MRIIRDYSVAYERIKSTNGLSITRNANPFGDFLDRLTFFSPLISFIAYLYQFPQ